MSSTTTDPHQGGDLFDMAKDGTTMPNDAGLQNTIPSVPRPGEADGEINGKDRNALAGGATNPTDISRSYRDVGESGEVVTGMGDPLPASVESKRLQSHRANDPASKGHERDRKHGKQSESAAERWATEGADVDLAPGEEEFAGREDVSGEEVSKVVEGRERKEI